MIRWSWMGHWLNSDARRGRCGARPGRFVGIAMHGGDSVGAPGPLHVLDRRLVVVGGTLPLDDSQRAGRADVQAHAHAVAEDLPHQDGLVLVVKLQRPLVACRGAERRTRCRGPGLSR